MTELRPAAAFFLLLLSLPLAYAETLKGRVVHITDGDTLVVLDASNVQHKIRLQGIDAPERGQAFGTKSKEGLSNLVAGTSVVVDYSKYDRYQRILGKVLLNGEDVNLEQVEDGMAWHYKKYQGEQSSSDRVRYSDAEREARRRKIGLWRDPTRCRHGSIGKPREGYERP
jgi:endonuclease YncB( thermonuclease family)